MLCVWHYMEALNCSSLPVSLLLCPGQVFAQFLQMSSAWHKRFLFGLALIRDLPRGPSAQELEQVGPRRRGKTRDQLQRGELAGR